MRIDKLDIKGFGKLSGASFRFTEGLNIIFGQNESGKSTLQAFIKAMLFGLKGGRASRDGTPAPLKRYRPWNGGSFGGVMEYRLENGLHFRVERDFEQNTAEIFDGSFNNLSGRYSTGKDMSLAFAEKHTGMSEACFERTAFVKQLETGLDEDGLSVLSSKLANTAETGFEDISYKKAEKALKEALLNHVGTGRSSVRPVDRINERLGELEAARESLKASARRLVRSREELEAEKEKQGRLLAGKAFIEKAGKLVRLRRQLEERMSAESALKESIKQIQEIEARLDSAIKERGDAAAASEKAAPRVRLGTLPAPLALLAASVLVLLFGHDFAPYSIAISGVLLLGGMGFLLFAFLHDGKSRSTEPGAGTAGTAGTGYEEKLQSMMRLKDRQKELYSRATLVCGARVGALSELKSFAAEASGAIAAYEKSLSEGVADISAGYRGAKYDPFNGESLEEVFYDASLEWLEGILSREGADIENSLGETRLKIRELETLCGNDPDDDEALQRIDEEEASLREKKTGLENVGASLKLALEVLGEAASEVRRSITPALEKRMSHIAGRMTGGRYEDLRLDEGLAINTVSPETGYVSGIGLLSGGTADQLYLALRLAAADVLAPGGEHVPVFLDEVFAQYDDIRTGETLKFLFEECEHRQAFLFTCKEREVVLAREVCDGKLNLLKL